jgi:hypothetical protein
VAQARLLPEALSPLQPAHVALDVLQTGVLPEQAELFVAVHATHVAVAVAHAGVAPEQSLSLAHCSHVPPSGPEDAQTRDRQRAVAVPEVQGPSPMAYPQLPSGSQTLERQTPGLFAHGPSPFR